jgi:type IV pilus assembly protein PilM
LGVGAASIRRVVRKKESTLGFDLFASKAPPVIGMDISSSSVKMLELSEIGKSQMRVDRYAISPLPSDAISDGSVVNAEALTEAIDRCFKKLGGRTKNLSMALPASMVIAKRIALPKDLRDDQIEAQILSDLEIHIPFKAEEVNIDFRVIGPGKSEGQIEILLAAAKKDKIDERVVAAEAAGLVPMILDSELMAVQAAFESILERSGIDSEGKIFALADIGYDNTAVMMIKDGDVKFSRQQSIGGGQLTAEIINRFGVDAEEAERIKRGRTEIPSGYREEVLAQFLSQIADEVKRSIALFTTQTEYGNVDRIFLTGGSASLPGLDAEVLRTTGVETEVANPFEAMVIGSSVDAEKLRRDAAGLLTAFGLALRRFDK